MQTSLLHAALLAAAITASSTAPAQALTDPETTKALQQLLDKQKARFEKLQSVQFSFTTLNNQSSIKAGKLLAPTTSHGHLTLQGNRFMGVVHLVMRSFDDAGYLMPATEKYSFDGHEYVTVDEQMRMITFGSKNRFMDHGPTVNPLRSIRTPIEQAFGWAWLPEEEHSYRQLARPETWNAARFTVEKIEELTEAGHPVSRITFLRPNQRSPQPMRHHVKFAHDLDDLPIEQRLFLSDSPTSAPYEYSNIQITDTVTTHTPFGKVTLPTALRIRVFRPDGTLDRGEDPRIVASSLILNEPLSVSHFQLPHDLPGYLTQNFDTKKDVTTTEARRARSQQMQPTDPVHEATTTDTQYQLRGDYTAHVKIQGAGGAAAGREYRLLYILGKDYVVFTSGTLDNSGETTITDLCGGEDPVRYRVYVDKRSLGTIHMTDEKKQRSFNFKLPPTKNDQLPDLELTELLTSNVVRLSSFRGKSVVLELWGRFCAPCQPAMTRLDEFASTATTQSKRDLQFLALTADESTTMVQKHVRDKQWNHLQHFLCSGQAYTSLIGRDGIPLTLVLDEKGTIIWRGHPSSKELDALLVKLTQ